MILHHAVDSLHLEQLPESVGLAAIFAAIGNETRLFLTKNVVGVCFSKQKHGAQLGYLMHNEAYATNCSLGERIYVSKQDVTALFIAPILCRYRKDTEHDIIPKPTVWCLI